MGFNSGFKGLNEDHKLNNLSEQSVSGASDSSNNLGKTSSLTCVNHCSGNTLLIHSTLTTSQNLSTEVPPKSKSKIKLSHQLNGSVPLTFHYQNVRGLRGKANELLSQLYPTFPHILCLSEHQMNHLELQQTFFDSYKLGVSYCRTLYEKEGI